MTVDHDLTCGHWVDAVYCHDCCPRTDRDAEINRLIAVQFLLLLPLQDLSKR